MNEADDDGVVTANNDYPNLDSFMSNSYVAIDHVLTARRRNWV